MAHHPVQHLNVIVDPTVAALGTNDDVPDGVPDPSSDTGGRNPGRYIRDGGSGVQPNRNTYTTELAGPPIADDDGDTFSVGDAGRQIQVLVGDTWAGTPTVSIVSGPTLPGATAVVVAVGLDRRIEYTPPATGGGGTDTIVYRLKGSQNSGHSDATLTVTVGDVPDPAAGRTYTGTGGLVGETGAAWPFRWAVVMDTWNGAANVHLTFEVGDDHGGPPDTPGQPTLILTDPEIDAIVAGHGHTFTLTVSGIDPDGAAEGSVTVH